MDDPRAVVSPDSTGKVLGTTDGLDQQRLLVKECVSAPATGRKEIALPADSPRTDWTGLNSRYGRELWGTVASDPRVSPDLIVHLEVGLIHEIPSGLGRAQALEHAKQRFPHGRELKVALPNPITPTWRNLYSAATLLFEAGELPGAAQTYASTLRLMNSDGLLSGLMINLSACYLEDGQPLQSLAWAVAALSVDAFALMAWYRADVAIYCLAVQASHSLPASSTAAATAEAAAQQVGREQAEGVQHLAGAAHELMSLACRLGPASKAARVVLRAGLKNPLPHEIKAAPEAESPTAISTAAATAMEVMLDVLTDVASHPKACRRSTLPAAATDSLRPETGTTSTDTARGGDEHGVKCGDEAVGDDAVTLDMAAAAAAKDLGDQHFHAKRFDDAAAAYMQGLAAVAGPLAVVLMDKAAVGLDWHEPVPSLLSAYAARLLAPLSRRAHHLLACLLVMQGQVPQAAAACQQGLEMMASTGSTTSDEHTALVKQLEAITELMEANRLGGGGDAAAAGSPRAQGGNRAGGWRRMVALAAAAVTAVVVAVAASRHSGRPDGSTSAQQWVMSQRPVAKLGLPRPPRDTDGGDGL